MISFLGSFILAGGVPGMEISTGPVRPSVQEVGLGATDDKAQKKVKVLGEVKKEGEIVWSKNLTLKKAIAFAGGFTRLARSTRVKVIREGKTTVFDIRKDDPKILPGDVIVVPERIF